MAQGFATLAGQTIAHGKVSNMLERAERLGDAIADCLRDAERELETIRQEPEVKAAVAPPSAGSDDAGPGTAG